MAVGWTLILSLVLSTQIVLFVFSGIVMVRRARSAPLPRGDSAPATVIVSIASLTREEAGIALEVLVQPRAATGVVFAAFDESEPAAQVVARALDTGAPNRNVSLVVGRDQFSENPKLDNLAKAYDACPTDHTILVDGNLRLPSDFHEQISERWTQGAAVVSTAPLAVEAIGFWAHLEAAVLNLSHARWLLAGDEIGIRFGHGKLLCFRKSWLEAHGGFDVLKSKRGEDTALSLLAAQTGDGLRLVRRPFEMPLGRRSWRQVLGRNMRWRRLRTHDVPFAYMSELLNPLWSMLLMGYLWALTIGVQAVPTLAVLFLFWHITEALVIILSRQKWSPIFQLSILVRDVIEPLLWLLGWLPLTYTWRGQTKPEKV